MWSYTYALMAAFIVTATINNIMVVGVKPCCSANQYTTQHYVDKNSRLMGIVYVDYTKLIVLEEMADNGTIVKYMLWRMNGPYLYVRWRDNTCNKFPSRMAEGAYRQCVPSTADAYDCPDGDDGAGLQGFKYKYQNHTVQQIVTSKDCLPRYLITTKDGKTEKSWFRNAVPVVYDTRIFDKDVSDCTHLESLPF